MPTEITGSVYAFDGKRKEVAVSFGLTPKVVRFSTDDVWKQDEEVVVTVTRRGKTSVALGLNLPALNPEG